jgi:hypothetical protein
MIPATGTCHLGAKFARQYVREKDDMWKINTEDAVFLAVCRLK